MIEYTTVGDIMVGEDAPPDVSQGWFPIGSDCLRAVRRLARRAPHTPAGAGQESK